MSLGVGCTKETRSKGKIAGCNSVHKFYANTARYLVTQVRIQDLVKGGAPASEAESCRHSEAESRERSEHSAAGVQGP